MMMMMMRGRGFTLAAGWRALDPERTVYRVSVESGVWDLGVKSDALAKRRRANQG